ncbi:MAG: DNA-binding protein [Deltaproteobacteria bacterium]|nr:DNA-binding protein [Deltaproteobacteria bacterium]
MRKREKMNRRISVEKISRGYPNCPQKLRNYLAAAGKEYVSAVGDINLVENELTALLCSVKCPGNSIIRTFDLARKLRDDGAAVISGFHSPMEKECLTILLRGSQPVVWCLARRLTSKKMRKEFSSAISEGRLLLLSPFDEKTKRSRKESAIIRNEFVVSLADKVIIAYLFPGGKTESFSRKVLESGKPLQILDRSEFTP